MIQLIQIFR